MRITTKAILICAISMISLFALSGTALADDFTSGPALVSGSYIATISADTVNVLKDEGSEEVITKAYSGNVFQVLEDCGNGYVKVAVGGSSGYLNVGDSVKLSAVSSAEEAYASTTESAAYIKRKNTVDFALSFVGCRYVYGGSNPLTGTDCSGFTKYVLEHAAGVTMNRSSGGQSSQGTVVSSSDMKMGDLLFYSQSGSIDHVAMYIGNGQIVHASTPTTGVKVSNWNYRTPSKIINILGA